ncbi:MULTISPECIES: MFS transporter [Streptococcus]|uniref:MFS transporter n=1 Tax=Streptococcus TaxID=1301 RepID=UPI000785B1D2|nr:MULTISPECIES: MFS transporter [Streptococcus]KXT65780.1 Multidrug resistance protein B [Streptococcus sp. DD04]MCY7218350.1 MFS transporter [Streptococcus cristatus]
MKQEKARKQDLLSILAVALVAFAGILSETSMNVTFPHLSQVFGLGLGVLQWITTGYLLAVAITITLGATLAHNWTERRILFTSLAIFSLGNLIATLAPDFTFLMIGRILQGGATGIAMPLMFNLIVERIPRKNIGLFMGLSGLVISLAPAIGPTYGGYMIASFDWHMIYTCILPVPIISFLLAYFNLQNSTGKSKRPFDVLGFLSLAVALSFSLMTISSLEEGASVNWLYLAVFLLSFAFFIWRSLTVQHPFLDIRILKEPTIFFGILPFLIFQFSNLSSNFLIPNFLVLVKNVSTAQAGFSLLPGTMIGAFMSPFLGKLYDNKGPKLSLFGGNSLVFLVMIVYSFFTNWLNLPLILVFYILFTLGRNMAFNNTMALSASQASKGKIADVTALFQLAQTFAGALGTAIAAVLLNQAPDTTTGVHNVFSLLLLLVSSNFIFYYFLFRAIKKKSQS